MKNTLVHSSTRLVRSSQAVPSLKAIAFTVGNLNLGLRIEQVYKVLGKTRVHGTGLDRVGIAHVGDREVMVVDLNQQLSGSIGGATEANYLVVAQNLRGDLVGISVAIVPTLKEVSLSNIRVLPDSYRQTALLGIATHVCQVLEEVPLTLFLIDVDKLLEIR